MSLIRYQTPLTCLRSTFADKLVTSLKWAKCCIVGTAPIYMFVFAYTQYYFIIRLSRHILYIEMNGRIQLVSG